MTYCKSSIRPHGGLITRGGGGGRLIYPGFIKDDGISLEKLYYKTLEVMQPRIKNKFKLPVGK